ncbi:MAG TPA: hypothetical protein VG405_07525 [Solirubrobacteraceae bacterium]|jgi:hypothetical protein|nr:hypothetical protein [Solirubrobacteraceae bacterium]
MPQPSYQTVKLARGRHVAPEAGVCVMELASMLAGEPFSDRPRSVSPVIAGFLRAYNDLIDDRRRQDLYGCAAEALGSAGPRDVEIARATRLQSWAEELQAGRWWRRLLPGRPEAAKRRPALKPHQAGPDAVHSIFRLTDELHGCVLALVEELVGMGRTREPFPSSDTALTAWSGSAQADAREPAPERGR